MMNQEEKTTFVFQVSKEAAKVYLQRLDSLNMAFSDAERAFNVFTYLQAKLKELKEGSATKENVEHISEVLQKFSNDRYYEPDGM